MMSRDSPHPATRRIGKTSQSTDEFPSPRRLYKVKVHNKEVGTMMLKDKVAVIYGSGGAVGSPLPEHSRGKSRECF
jgi:hypothetical protein